MQVNPYLNFNGDCAAAFWRNRVLHPRLTVGNTVLMAPDSPPEHYEKPQGLYVSLQIDTPAEADRIFRNQQETRRCDS